MTNPLDGTGAGLITFLNRTIDKRELVQATANSYRTAARRVLDGEEGWESLDLRSADIDGIVRRFANRNRGEFKAQSLATYESRFRSAVTMYLTYLDGGNWRPRARGDRAADAPVPRTTKARPPKSASTALNPVAVGDGSSSRNDPMMITFPLPIRPGVRGQLLVPEDLSVAEARRICQVVSALAVQGADDE